jgi:hypothetical protein
MGQGPSWKANSRSAGQKFPAIYWNRVYKSPPEALCDIS